MLAKYKVYIVRAQKVFYNWKLGVWYISLLWKRLLSFQHTKMYSKIRNQARYSKKRLSLVFNEKR